MSQSTETNKNRVTTLMYFVFDLYQIAMLAFFIITATQGNINKKGLFFVEFVLNNTFRITY